MFRVYVHDGSVDCKGAVADVAAEVDAYVCDAGHPDAGTFRACQGLRRCVYHTFEEAINALVIERVDLVSASHDARKRLQTEKDVYRTVLGGVSFSHDPKEDRLLAYAKRFKVTLHKKGKIVFAPPGSGKSVFVGKNREWVDVDIIAGELSLHTERWAQQRHRKKAEHYKTIDVWLQAMKNVGFHVLGSLYWDYVPDEIVIIPEDVHKKYVGKRKDLTWEEVARNREWLLKLAQKHKIRVVDSFKLIS